MLHWIYSLNSTYFCLTITLIIGLYDEHYFKVSTICTYLMHKSTFINSEMTDIHFTSSC